MKKKLYRSKEDKIVAGIFGGLGEYTGMDSNLWRLIGLLIFIFTSGIPFLIAYLIAIFIVPIKEGKEENK